MNRLAGKSALVVGAASGIGREVCRLFASEGADVAVADHARGTDAARLAEEIKNLGRDAFAIDVDVADDSQVASAVEAAIARFENLDILVNNAGVGSVMKPFHEGGLQTWDRIMTVNLRGVASGMEHVLPHMLKRGYGRIINTASQLAHKPAPGAAVYSAAKAGVVALSVSVAQEVAASGITVNVVCPGPTDTPMWQQSDAEWNKAKILSLPMRRIGRPIEIAWAYVYLASDEASFVTGQSLSPNGGDVMW
jgi:NAD(P)-dependent dehydrogenase (short-subunit alcohol dehydrogenase family)